MHVGPYNSTFNLEGEWKADQYENYFIQVQKGGGGSVWWGPV